MFGVGSAWGKLMSGKTNTSGVFYCMLTVVGKSLYWGLLGITDRWPIFWGSKRGEMELGQVHPGVHFYPGMSIA
jgi:hypothetical protein